MTRWTMLQVPAPALSAGGPGAETHLPATGGELCSPCPKVSGTIFSVLPPPPPGNSRNDTIMENENPVCNCSVSVRVVETENTVCNRQYVFESYGN